MNPGEGGRQCEEIASSCGGSKGGAAETARPLRLQCADCEGLLHELSNVITGVLMNAQVLEWKLPPYSHLKRSVREVERNAQRGGELLKRLMRRLANGEAEAPSAEPPGDRAEAVRVAVSGELSREGIGEGPLNLTSDCDPCTSGFFPKRDDGNEH